MKNQDGSSEWIVVIGCGAAKRETPCPAADLYTGSLFKMAKRLALNIGCDWYILSAKYGLLAPRKIIAPYESTLSKMPIEYRRRWAARVGEDIMKTGAAGVLSLAGYDFYTKPLEPILLSAGIKLKCPMKNMTLGHQKSYLNAQVERLKAQRRWRAE